MEGKKSVHGAIYVTTSRAPWCQVDGQRTCVFSGWNGLFFFAKCIPG